MIGRYSLIISQNLRISPPSPGIEPPPPASGRPLKPLCYTDEVRIPAPQAEQAGLPRCSVYPNPPRGSNQRLRHARPAAYHSSTRTI